MHPDASNGHFSHNHTIPPTDSTPQRSKRTAQHEVTAKGAAGIPIFHQFPANSLPAPRRPLSSSATPRTTAQSGHRTTLPDGQNAHPGAEQPTRDDTTPPPRASPPPSPSAILRTTAQSDHRTTPLNGQNAPHGTEWPPNRTPQWPKYAIRHKEAEEQHAKPPASAETRLPEDEICTYNR